MKKGEKLWGGRFQTLPSDEMIEFISGRDVRALPPSDEKLIPYDLWGSRAHALMLCRQGIISIAEGKKIFRGLEVIERLHQDGKFRLDPSKEDVHTNIESFLIKTIGVEAGGKIHTGRSRNDQVTLDMRLYLRDQVVDFADGLLALMDVLLRKAEQHRATVMPGYTHHQHATATTFGHLLVAFGEGLWRDIQRWIQWLHLFNHSPLGAAAGYGTSFKLDRKLTSRLLGFYGPSENTTDPVMQRWEPELEVAYNISAMLNHLSTMAQTFILLSTREFQMVRLDDRHSSGSSIMPQKRNPDALEAIKAKAAFSHGVLVSLLSIGKGLFVGYNRESQWTKYWIMDLVEESKPALRVMAEVVDWLQVHERRMEEEARRDFLGATPLMEWMVRSWRLPLRQAKQLMEKAVRYSEEKGLEEVSHQSLMMALREMKIHASISEKEVKELQDPIGVLARVNSIGMPSDKRIQESIRSLRKKTAGVKRWWVAETEALEKAKRTLLRMEREIERGSKLKGQAQRKVKK